jgi:hypothetical protein
VPITFRILNTGTANLSSITLTAATNDTNITIAQGTATITDVSAGSSKLNSDIIVKRTSIGERIFIKTTLASGGKTVTQRFVFPYSIGQGNQGTFFKINDGLSDSAYLLPMNELVAGKGNGDQAVNPGELITVFYGPVNDWGVSKILPVYLLGEDPLVKASFRLGRSRDDWSGHYYATQLLISSDAAGKSIDLYSRYDLKSRQDNKIHVFYSGTLTLNISGSDQTPPLPGHVNVKQAGSGSYLVEAEILDGGNIPDATVKLSPRGSGTQATLTLHDDGKDGDIDSADGVYSALWQATGSGTYDITVSATDASNNSVTDESVGSVDLSRLDIIPGTAVRQNNIVLKCIPNPFSSSVDIQVLMPNVECGMSNEIVIYDIRGKQIARFNQFRIPHSEFGIRHTWSPKTCPNGIYIVRVQTGNQIKISKLMLIK